MKIAKFTYIIPFQRVNQQKKKNRFNCKARTKRERGQRRAKMKEITLGNKFLVKK